MSATLPWRARAPTRSRKFPEATFSGVTYTRRNRPCSAGSSCPALPAVPRKVAGGKGRPCHLEARSPRSTLLLMVVTWSFMREM
ncbi:MAG: hypothetical protein ACK55Z_31405, partial [bacterium]